MRGVERGMEMTAKARELRRNQTEAERALWLQVCNRRLEGNKFRRQQPIGPYVVDFVCFEKKVIIELDGGQHSEQIVYDTKRDAWLESQGYRVLRFWNNQLLGDIEAVLETLKFPSP